MKRLSWFVLVFCLLSNASLAGAEPLETAEFRAIVDEVLKYREEDHEYRQNRHRQRQDKDNWDLIQVPLPLPQWKVLDRDKLARLIEMPEFPDLPSDIKETLVDLAGAYDLMRYESPADMLALWKKWFPGKSLNWQTDWRWASRSGAMIALFDCYPEAAWSGSVQDEPMLSVIENSSTWIPSNTSDFGMCVRKQSDVGGGVRKDSPDTERGLRSAAVLEDVLSSALLKYRCTGDGPNRCLPMVYALISLNRKNERLSAIFQAIEPHFAPYDDASIHASLQDELKLGRHISTEEKRLRVYELARATLRKIIYLTVKLTALLEQPKAWPEGELERTVGMLAKLTMTLNRITTLGPWLKLRDTLSSSLTRDFANPWTILNEAKPMTGGIENALRRSGREQAADVPGCEAVFGEPLKVLPSAFWQGYTEEKLRREQTTCGAPVPTDVAKPYTETATPSPSVRSQTITSGASFQSATAREMVDALISARLPSEKTHDPREYASTGSESKNEEDQSEHEDEYEESEEIPPQECPDALPGQIGRQLGYLIAPRHIACRLSSDIGIIALLFPSLSTEPVPDDADEQAAENTVFDLEVLVVESANGEILSRALYEQAYYSDAFRLNDLEIDPEFYDLAPDKSAFGIRVSHSMSSHAAPGGEKVLSLFVREGPEIRRVLSDWVIESSHGEWDTNCAGHFEERRSLISVASDGDKGKKGYADLSVTTITSESKNEMIEDECVDVEAKARERTSRTTLRYDGGAYVLTKEAKTP